MCIIGQKGFDGGRKRRAGTRETEDRLDGWCEGGLGQQRNDGGGIKQINEGLSRQCAKDRKESRALVHK